MRALVVEQSKTYRLVLNEFLHGFSITHDVATSGESALSLLQKQPYNIVIITKHLPDMSGEALANKIKSLSKNRNISIILLSGEQNTNKLKAMNTVDINFICQKHDFEQLKSIFAELTQNELVICHASGNILYIEDHLTIANMTIEILQQMGLSVEHYNSADAGLLAFEKNDYDLILLDMILPGENDGISMIEKVRASIDYKKDTPILALSATLNDSQKIHALKKGASDFISKPVIQAELAVRVKNLIVARQLYQQVIDQKKILEKMAMTDQLTGLHNRYFLAHYSKQALSSAKRHHHPLSIVMIDLDKFKQINDNLGHDQGDKVLVNIAQILQKECRTEDASIRLGGDEFLLILAHCPLEEAKKKADDIRQIIWQYHINNPLNNPNNIDVAPISASLGVASTEQGEFNFDQLLSLADKAAYQAKAQDGNNTQWLIH